MIFQLSGSGSVRFVSPVLKTECTLLYTVPDKKGCRTLSLQTYEHPKLATESLEQFSNFAVEALKDEKDLTFLINEAGFFLVVRTNETDLRSIIQLFYSYRVVRTIEAIRAGETTAVFQNQEQAPWMPFHPVVDKIKRIVEAYLESVLAEQDSYIEMPVAGGKAVLFRTEKELGGDIRLEISLEAWPETNAALRMMVSGKKLREDPSWGDEELEVAVRKFGDPYWTARRHKLTRALEFHCTMPLNSVTGPDVIMSRLLALRKNEQFEPLCRRFYAHHQPQTPVPSTSIQ